MFRAVLAKRNRSIDRGNIQIGDDRGDTGGHVNLIGLGAWTARSRRLVKTEAEQPVIDESCPEKRQGWRDRPDQLRRRRLGVDTPENRKPGPVRIIVVYAQNVVKVSAIPGE
jgi:hypothetical protein